MNDKVVHIDVDGEIGKTAAMLKDELQTVVDSYAGSINNAEAIGVLMLQVLDVYMSSRGDKE